MEGYFFRKRNNKIIYESNSLMISRYQIHLNRLYHMVYHTVLPEPGDPNQLL